MYAGFGDATIVKYDVSSWEATSFKSGHAFTVYVLLSAKGAPLIGERGSVPMVSGAKRRKGRLRASAGYGRGRVRFRPASWLSRLLVAATLARSVCVLTCVYRPPCARHTAPLNFLPLSLFPLFTLSLSPSPPVVRAHARARISCFPSPLRRGRRRAARV